MRHTRSIVLLVLLGGLLLPPAAALAQSSVRSLPEVPALSPPAEVYQRVGLADVRVTYSSPAQRGRVVWGELVPYGELWRAGANAPTRLSVSEDFTFGGTPVPAGEYSVFIRPEASSWTFILNRDPERSGIYAYDASADVAQAAVTPTAGPNRERMLFVLAETTDNDTRLTLEWAGLQGGVPLAVDTPALARRAIDSNLAEIWRPHFNAARYYLDSGQDLAQAEAWMARSIELEETWWNRWFMARIQAARENYAAARASASRAMELGAGNDTWERAFRGEAEEALASWPQ
jgi:hypothetical protein